MSDSVGVGSISKISLEFNETDPKDIRKGLKNCFNYENRIANAEKELLAQKQRVTIQPELDQTELINGILQDMGEEGELNNERYLLTSKSTSLKYFITKKDKCIECTRFIFTLITHNTHHEFSLIPLVLIPL